MKIYEHHKILNSEFELILKQEDKKNDSELAKLKEEIKKDIFSQENENIKAENKENNIIINNNDITNSLKLNKKYLKLLFSLSILFNRIVIFKELNPDEKKEYLTKIKEEHSKCQEEKSKIEAEIEALKNNLEQIRKQNKKKSKTDRKKISSIIKQNTE